jgi:hypothetical protein
MPRKPARKPAPAPLVPSRKLPCETHRGLLSIGGIKIGCVNLDNGARLFSRSALTGAFGAEEAGDEPDPPAFLAGVWEGMSFSLRTSLLHGTRYLDTRGKLARGYDAALLPKVCQAFIDAGHAGALRPEDKPLERLAHAIRYGLARAGLMGLVDEATGYQEVRAGDALALALGENIARHLVPWASELPGDLLREVFKLQPLDVADFLRRYIYDPLPGGALIAGPRDEPGPELRKQIGEVFALCKLSETEEEFAAYFRRLHPRG